MNQFRKSLMLFVVVAGMGFLCTAYGGSEDAALAKARKFVESSDRYLHHSKLKRGMKGYGLSVFAGTKIERFDVEIISVVRNFSPQQDVIFSMLSGQKLDKSRVIQGMSGSPVFIKDPADGKFKMIGAVALGWSLSTEPLAGIQPITQMLALPGVLEEAEKVRQAEKSKVKPAAKPAPSTKPATQPKTKPTTKPASRPARASAAGMSSDEFLAAVLAPGQVDISRFYRSKHKAASARQTPGRLVPLMTPIAVSGCSEEALDFLTKALKPMGMMPVQGGGVGSYDDKELAKVKLAPGSAVCIPLVTGDANWAGLGTVTDVIGNKVLAFGHGMFAEGNVDLPMSTGYVHTIVMNLITSFKLGSSIKQVGQLNRDENVAVAGNVGPDVKMIPMTVDVNQVQDGRKQKFNYKIIKEDFYTPIIGAILVLNSATALRYEPRYNHVSYEVKIDFGKLGKLRAANISTGDGTWPLLFEIYRPLMAMMHNPFGSPPEIKNIDVNVTIAEGDIGARIVDFKLDGELYKPGDTIKGKVLLERFRKKRIWMPVEFELPADLPDGKYPLTVGGASYAGMTLQRESPQKYDPKTVAELLAAIQRVMKVKNDRLYLHLPLPEGGVAVGQDQLPDMPGGKAQVLIEAKLPDTKLFRESILKDLKVDYVIFGRKTLHVNVRKQTNETIVR